jgi:acetyl esterase/lipase
MTTILLLCALAAADAPVRVVKDIPYLTSAHYADNKDTLDIYSPAGAAGAPVIVWYYGGALTQGDKSDATAAGAGKRFASAGIVTAVVNYRLSPGVSHPAHVEDAAASFAWVKRHIAEYGGDPNQIFVVGHSAGAYLLALLALDGRYLAKHGMSPRDIRGMAPISAFYWVERTGVAPDRPKFVWGTDEKAWIDASPAHHLRADAPAMLIVYADGDEPWRRQQNVEMAQALQAAGSRRVEIVQITDRTHMSILRKLPEDGDPAAARVVEFVRAVSGVPSGIRH